MCFYTVTYNSVMTELVKREERRDEIREGGSKGN